MQEDRCTGICAARAVVPGHLFEGSLDSQYSMWSSALGLRPAKPPTTQPEPFGGSCRTLVLAATHTHHCSLGEEPSQGKAGNTWNCVVINIPSIAVDKPSSGMLIP